MNFLHLQILAFFLVLCSVSATSSLSECKQDYDACIADCETEADVSTCKKACKRVGVRCKKCIKKGQCNNYTPPTDAPTAAPSLVIETSPPGLTVNVCKASRQECVANSESRCGKKFKKCKRCVLNGGSACNGVSFSVTEAPSDFPSDFTTQVPAEI